MALGAIQNNHGGAWRVWRLSHHIDGNGSGRVDRSPLSSRLDALGVTPRSRRRWVEDATQNVGVITPAEAKNGVCFYLDNLGNAARKLGARGVGSRPVELMQVDSLFKTGWRAEVWRCFIASRNIGDAMPISREKMEELTGVPPRTQRHYEEQRVVEKRANYCPTDTVDPSENFIEYLNDVFDRDYFRDNRKRLNQRLPDIRTVPGSIAKAGKKGRTRKAKIDFGRRKGLSIERRANGVEQSLDRVFYDTEKAAAKNGGLYCKTIKEDVNEWEEVERC